MAGEVRSLWTGGSGEFKRGAVGILKIPGCRCRRSGRRTERIVSTAGGNVVLVKGKRARRAGGCVHKSKLLVDAEGTAGDGADGVARREIAEELAAIIVDASAGADNELALESARLPGGANARANTPLATRECGIAHSRSAVGVVAGDDEACAGNVVGCGAIAIELGLEVEESTVFLGQAAI